MDFQSFQKSNFVRGNFFENLIIHKPSLKLREVPHKFGSNQFSRFDIYWIHSTYG